MGWYRKILYTRWENLGGENVTLPEKESRDVQQVREGYVGESKETGIGRLLLCGFRRWESCRGGGHDCALSVSSLGFSLSRPLCCPGAVLHAAARGDGVLLL